MPKVQVFVDDVEWSRRGKLLFGPDGEVVCPCCFSRTFEVQVIDEEYRVHVVCSNCGNADNVYSE
jgi:hypothetical protein